MGFICDGGIVIGLVVWSGCIFRLDNNCMIVVIRILFAHLFKNLLDCVVLSPSFSRFIVTVVVVVVVSARQCLNCPPGRSSYPLSLSLSLLRTLTLSLSLSLSLYTHPSNLSLVNPFF